MSPNGFHLEKVNEDHFTSLFEEFFSKPSVVDEFTHLIDPRPDVKIDIEVVRRGFDAVGFDSETLTYFEFDTFIRLFADTFYTAAAKQTELQGAIEIGLLRSTVEQLSNITTNTHKTAIASEQIAAATDETSSTLEKFLQGQIKITDLTKAIEEAITRGFEQSYEMQEKLIAALYKNGYDVTVNNGNVVIGDSNRVENTVTPQALGELQAKVSRLRHVVDIQKVNEENLSIIETRYRQHIVRRFERLTFQGMMRTAQAISLPLEDVYVELRAVGEVPEAADTFSVEERRLLLEIDGAFRSARSCTARWRVGP